MHDGATELLNPVIYSLLQVFKDMNLEIMQVSVVLCALLIE